MVELWQAGSLSSKDLCAIAYLASQAGACGVADLAVDPNSKGDHQHRFLTKALKVNDISHMVQSVDPKLYSNNFG